MRSPWDRERTPRLPDWSMPADSRSGPPASIPVAAPYPRVTALRRLARIGGTLWQILSGLALVYTLVGPNRRADIVRAWHGRVCRALGVRVQSEGVAHAGALWVANHISWLDIAVLGALGEVRFLSKAEVREWPLVGPLAARTGTLFMPRGSGQQQALADMVTALRAGHTVVVFAEGTTTDGGEVRRLFPRLFEAALLAGTPVQPVLLRYPPPHGAEAAPSHPAVPYLGEDTLAASITRIAGAQGVRAEVTFLPPLTVQGPDEAVPASDLAPAAGRSQLARACEQALRAELTRRQGHSPESTS